MTNKHKGSTFDSFLKEEGILEETEATAIKRVIAYQLEQAMEKKHLTKSEIAGKMRTSRSALERLLDPSNTSITLYTLVKLARVLGKKLKLSFA
jgi:antitoxin HicB